MMTDEMLYRAAKQVNTAIVEHWEQHEVEEHSFSLRFERRIRRLTRKANNPQLYRFLNKVACLLLTALVSFAAVMTFDVEARAAFVSWVKEIYEDSIVYRFYGDREESASLNYRVTWVPEGYVLVDEYESDTIYSAIYQKGENIQEVFVIEWYLISEDRQIQYLLQDSEYDCIDISLNNAKGFFYPASIDGESNSLLWIDEKNGVTFNMNSLLDFDTMLKIAESIVPVEEEKVYLDYHVTWVPEGYVLVEEVYENSMCFSIYDNPDTGDGFLFECYDLSVYDWMELLADDNYNQIEVMVNGIKADFYQSKVESKSNNLIWHNENESLIFSVDSYLPMEDMIKIAESVQKVN